MEGWFELPELREIIQLWKSSSLSLPVNKSTLGPALRLLPEKDALMTGLLRPSFMPLVISSPQNKEQFSAQAQLGHPLAAMGRKGLDQTVEGYGFFVPVVTGKKGLETDVKDTGPEEGEDRQNVSLHRRGFSTEGELSCVLRFAILADTLEPVLIRCWKSP